jgi:nucleotide-binding universal stress UspA family protein
MIVVGSRHVAAERRMSDADHALQVLRSTHAAVLVAPDDRPVSPTIRRIVVGFDDGAGSHDAVDAAIELAEATGAHVHVVAVVPHETAAWWLAGDAVEPAALDRWVGQRRAELADAAREALRRAGDVDTSYEVLSGGAIPRLLEASADADLLVLGSRRWARLAHVVLGSVSEPIVRMSTCPTLVVPRRRRSSADGDSHLTASAQS